MTVVVHLVGGLGNQLFQLAAAAHLASQVGRDLIVDVTEVRLVHDRIGLLPLYDDLTTIDLGIPGLPLAVNARQARIRQGRTLGRAAGITLHTIDELESFVDDGTWPAIHMHGLFMSRAFATEACSSGRPYHPQVRTPSPWLEWMAERMRFENPVGIHIRRGDYLREPERGVLTRNYYERALQQAATHDRPIWAFSDDPAEARTFLASLSERLEFIQVPKGVPAAESLMLLAGASTIVACNSTFSWWAAFLSDADVVIPDPFGLESLTWNAHQRARMLDPAWLEVEAEYA